MRIERNWMKLARRRDGLAGTSGPTSSTPWALRAVIVLLTSAGSGGEARAQEGDPELPLQCGYVAGLREGSVGVEQYWGAVPRDLLLIPIYYVKTHEDSPPALEIVESLPVEVVDPADPSVPVSGTVVSVNPPPGAEDFLLRWVPDAPLEAGKTYEARVGPATLQDPPECEVRYQLPLDFSFTVTSDSWKDWVNGAEMALRLTGSGGGLGCCETMGEPCEDTMDCFQCWDRWDQPVVQVLWAGQGLPYLTFSTEALSGPLRESGDVPSNATVVSAGLLVAQLTLTGLGEYCVLGSVSGPGAASKSEQRCDTFTQQDLDNGLAGLEQCRTRVPSADCAQLPAGMTEVSSLYVVYGSTEDEARAALAAAPYHPLEGCYTLDDPTATPTPTMGTGGTSSEDVGAEDADVGGQGGSGDEADVVGAAGTTGALPGGAGSQANAQAPSPEAGTSAGPTTSHDAGVDAGAPRRELRRAPAPSGRGDAWCAIHATSTPGRPGVPWALAAACVVGLLGRRRPSHPSERRTAS